jgi:hypothetical protein
MVDAVFVEAAESEIEGGGTEVLQERRVVRARPERGDPQIGSRTGLVARLGRSGCDDRRLPSLPDAHPRIRILDVSSDGVDEAFERV